MQLQVVPDHYSLSDWDVGYWLFTNKFLIKGSEDYLIAGRRF